MASPSQAAPIAAFPVPRDTKGPRSFLGIDSYYSRLFHDHARIAEPLQQLLVATAQFRRAPEQEKESASVKRGLVTATLMMAHPQRGKCVIECNASTFCPETAFSSGRNRGGTCYWVSPAHVAHQANPDRSSLEIAATLLEFCFLP